MARTPPVVNTAAEATTISQLLRSVNASLSIRILLASGTFHRRPAQGFLSVGGLKVVPFLVDFKACWAWADRLWLDPLWWLPAAGSLANSSGALRNLFGCLVYRAW